MIDNIIYKKVDGVKMSFIPKKDFVGKQAMVCFNYGSKDRNFILDNKAISFPPGTAHFLEHKMFEDKNKNIFDVFNKLGANINAYTNFTTTAYYFDCIDNFYEGFDELLNMVSSPYFTDENVEKEKPIIAQEIKMYEDDPYWRVYFNLLNIMFNKNNPLVDDIAGSIADIQKINKNTLYECYNNFYTRDNAMIILAGGIEEENKIIDSINCNLKINVEKGGKVSHFEEKQKNSEEKVEKKMGINQKIFNLGFKNDEIYDRIEETLINNKILLDLVFGKGSEFYDKLYSKNIINDSFGFDFNIFNNSPFSVFSGSSEKPEEILKHISQEIETFKNGKILKKDFERIKKKQFGRFIRSFNVLSSIISMEADFFSRGFNINDYYKAFECVSIEGIEQSIKNMNTSGFLSIIT